MNFINLSDVCVCCLGNLVTDERETFFAYCDKHQGHMSNEHDDLYNGDVDYYIIADKDGIRHYMLTGVNDYEDYEKNVKSYLTQSLSKFGYNDILISKSKQKLLSLDNYKRSIEMSKSIKHIETSIFELKNIINDLFNIYRVSTN